MEKMIMSHYLYQVPKINTIKFSTADPATYGTYYLTVRISESLEMGKEE